MIKRVDKKSEDAVVTDQAQKKMKEIVYDEQKHTVVDAKFNFKEVLDSFLEKTRAEAEALLKQLVSEKKISEFRLNPIGVAVTDILLGL